jgi:hypothetical protein
MFINETKNLEFTTYLSKNNISPPFLRWGDIVTGSKLFRKHSKKNYQILTSFLFALFKGVRSNILNVAVIS